MEQTKLYGQLVRNGNMVEYHVSADRGEAVNAQSLSLAWKISDENLHATMLEHVDNEVESLGIELVSNTTMENIDPKSYMSVSQLVDAFRKMEQHADELRRDLTTAIDLLEQFNEGTIVDSQRVEVDQLVDSYSHLLG